MKEPVLIAIVCGVIFVLGVMLGSDNKADSMMTKCYKANPEVPIGEAKQFCQERLYLK